MSGRTDFTTLRVESLRHGVKRLVLSRPDVRNAFDEKMMEELAEVLKQLEGIPDPDQMRLLVLTGEGKVFSAGADLGYMKRLSSQGEAESLVDAKGLAGLFYALASFPAPVICAVRGAAIGGGLGLTVCADYVLAEDNASFATSEVRLGLVPAVISPYIVRKIGLANAAPLMLSGRRIKAPEARELGVVQHVTSAERFDAALQEVVREFLQAGPEAARRTKKLLLKEAPLPDPELVTFTAETIAQARSSEEGRRGLDSFFKKTASPWTASLEE